MKKNQILTLNNIVFRIAQKKDKKAYLDIMKYSDFLNKENEKYVEEAKKIARYYKTEKKSYKNKEGQDVEYFAIPLGMEDKANDEIQKIGEQDFNDKPKGKAGDGKSLFYGIIKDLPISEITGEIIEDVDGKEHKIKNYSYNEQLIISEIIDES